MVDSYDTEVFSRIFIECGKCPRGKRPVLAEFYLSDDMDQIVSAKNRIEGQIKASDLHRSDSTLSSVIPIQMREQRYAIDRCPICTKKPVTSHGTNGEEKASLDGGELLRKRKGIGQYDRSKTLDVLKAVWNELQDEAFIKVTPGIRLKDKHDNRQLYRGLPIFQYVNEVQEKRLSGDTDSGLSTILENYETFVGLERQHERDKTLIMSTKYFQKMMEGLEMWGYIGRGRPLALRGRNDDLSAPNNQLSIRTILIAAGAEMNPQR